MKDLYENHSTPFMSIILVHVSGMAFESKYLNQTIQFGAIKRSSGILNAGKDRLRLGDRNHLLPGLMIAWTRLLQGSNSLL